MRLSFPHFQLKTRVRRYAVQVVLATSVLGAVLLTQDLLAGGVAARAVLIAAVASTSFILFVSPNPSHTRSRQVVGGHLIALACGSAFAGLIGSDFGKEWIDHYPLLFDLNAALGVGFSMFAMGLTNTEHPPAAGTALGVVAHGFTWQLVVFVVTSAILLATIHRLLQPHLKNLYYHDSYDRS